jgi:hypothetical protein
MGEVKMQIKSAALSGILLASSAMVACGGGYRANYVAYSVPPPLQDTSGWTAFGT